MPENLLPNVAILREELIANAKLLATPIDFIDLVDRGILGPAKRGWYELLRVDLLPKHARQQVKGLKQIRRGDESRTYLQFGKYNASAAKFYQRLTSKPLKAS
jgi:hypothetical protein